jgi:hypothetical protein
MKKMTALMAMMMAVGICMFCAPAVAQADNQKVLSQVEDLLAGYEFVPKKEDWDRIGPAAAGVLKDIAADSARKKVQRARAVSSLAFFPQVETQRFLTTLLGEKTQSMTLRRKAMRALAFGFGSASIDTIKPYLSSNDPHLRATAIKSFGVIKTDQSVSLLSARLEVEPSKVLQKSIERALVEMDNQ